LEFSLVSKLLSIGLAAGVLSGLFGIGGGIIIVPLLVYLLGMTQVAAQGVSVGALLLPVGILAALKYHKAGNFNISYSLLVAAGMFFGAYFGAWAANSLDMAVMKKLFGVLLCTVGIKLVFFP
jgi:uncharacterized protein